MTEVCLSAARVALAAEGIWRILLQPLTAMNPRTSDASAQNLFHFVCRLCASDVSLTGVKQLPELR
jgi:hypothetical protein